MTSLDYLVATKQTSRWTNELRYEAGLELKPNPILIDLDGVLVDFVRGAFRFHNKSIPYRQVKWDFDKILFPEDRSKFWEGLGFDFWAGLDWTKEGPDLLDGILAFAKPEEICFCTSPCDTVGSIEGKIEWLRRNVPASLKRNFIISPVKQFSAGCNSILIDDNDGNCEKFKEAGGKNAVLIPQPWNRNENLMIGESYNVDKILEIIKLAWSNG